MDHKGNGIGRIENKVVFVPKSVIGDVCDIDIYKSNKKYDIGKVSEIVKRSELRIDSICPYYEVCGGCNISNLSYEEQLNFKVGKVKNIFKRYLNMEINPSIVPSKDEYGYRNKITYHVDNGIGLVSEYDGIVNIDKCLLVSDRVNELYYLIKNSDLSDVSRIIIKECDNGLILSIYGDMNIDKFKDKCLSIYMDDICVYNTYDGYIMISDIKYRVSNKSFFQVNTKSITNLYDEIVKYGKFSKDDRVVDLYCGVGSISLYIAKYVKNVLGIEIIEDAVNDAWENAKNNNIDNVDFLCGDVSKFVEDNIDCDVLIVDPPRIGLDKKTIQVINSRRFKRIVYVSCDPMTLVRDLGMLNNYYVSDISLVDMFPQTHHVECVIKLHRKK